MRRVPQLISAAGCLGWLLLCVGVAPTSADEEIDRLKSEMRTMSETISQLQQTVVQMQGAIAKYEQQASVPPAQGSVAELRGEFQGFKNMVDQLVKINGYYDFEWYNDDKKSSPSSFRQHHLSFFFDKKIESWHFFSELEFEFAFDVEGNGGTVTGSGESKIETAWLEYNYSDLLNIRAGKLLMPQYWTANHYPSQTLSTSTPLLVKRVIPFDTTGVSAYGTHYWENAWGASYNVFVGNGEAASRSETDANEDKVFGGKWTVHIPLFDRFDVATSSYIGANADDKSEWMWGGETQINIKNFELLTEVAHNNNEGQFGYYVQPGYRFLPKWTTFYRLDSRDDNNKIDGANDAMRNTIGIRYQPLPAISLKAELFRHIPDDEIRERYNGVLSSVVIFF